MERISILLILYVFLSLNVNSQEFVKQRQTKSHGLSSDRYMEIALNGAWCWFSDPRAVYYERMYKRTYAGWVNNFGDVYIGYYDHVTHKIDSFLIYKELEIDDHNNPSILFDEDGKLLVFFNMHMKGVQPLFLIKSARAEDITEWGELKKLFLNDAALQAMGSMNHTYTNPVKLSGEHGRIFLFWRGVDGKPSYSYSDDNGETWSTGRILFMPERTYSFRRPYVKVYSDGLRRIHFTLTDGHPLKEEDNSIYYFYYEQGAFFKADGTKIKALDELPIMPSEADVVYNAMLDENRARAWNWDIAQTEEGAPVIAYSKYPTPNDHIYCYAVWDNKSWKNYDLINSGGWFPKTMPGAIETEPYYSGGISIDHETPNTVYLSVKRDSVFEIEKWTCNKKKTVWDVEQVTSGSDKDNIRPFAVRGAGKDNPLQVLWMENTRYIHFAFGNTLKKAGGSFADRFLTAIKTNLPKNERERDE